VIANRSSGRQGYALAEVARRLGATVTLVSTAERDLALDVAASIEVVRVESGRRCASLLERSRPGLRDHGGGRGRLHVIPASEKIKKDAGIPR